MTKGFEFQVNSKNGGMEIYPSHCGQDMIQTESKSTQWLGDASHFTCQKCGKRYKADFMQFSYGSKGRMYSAVAVTEKGIVSKEILKKLKAQLKSVDNNK